LATNRDYQSFDLNKRRDAVLKHIGDYVPEVPTLFLLGSVLPQILPAHVDQVESKLRQGRHLVKSGDDTLWAVFSKSPSGMSEREDVAFAPFDSIWKNTVRMGHKVLKKSPTLTFNQNPDRTPVSDRDDLARPDGQCALADEQTIQALADLEMSYSHYSSVVLWEFKKKSNVKDISDVGLYYPILVFNSRLLIEHTEGGLELS
jgi:hypothetical protein